MRAKSIEKMGKKVSLCDPKMPQQIKAEITAEKMDGIPFFYESYLEGTVGSGKKAKNFMLGIGINGGAMYVRVGDDWYALPLRQFLDSFVQRIHGEKQKCRR